MSPRTAGQYGSEKLGVRIAGVGHYLPEGELPNTYFETILDTSDEWITKRTGIKNRRKCNVDEGESCRVMCAGALQNALKMARMEASELDLLIIGTCTGESTVPSVACRVAAMIGCEGAGAFDITAACSGFVYSLNVAHDLIKSGSYRSIGVVGADEMSSIMDYKDRAVCVLFGDAAGAAVVRATDDTTKGMISQVMHSDGTAWKELYRPRHQWDVNPETEEKSMIVGKLQMNGRQIYKFAVSKFSEVIEETLERANMKPEDVDHFVCHQSNARILESARERFGIPEEKLYINIDRYGNTSAGSVPLCLSELWNEGRIKEGERVMLLAFGAGLTWGSSLWQL